MKQILLAEDSTMFGRLMKAKLEKSLDVPVFWTKTLKDTINILEMGQDNFGMALLDFNLPDGPNGEVIEEVVSRGIPAFVFTGNLTDEVRELVWSKKVADYVLKDDPDSLSYIISAVTRIRDNEHRLVLLVHPDDEVKTRLAERLYIQRYRVLTAKDGESASAILNDYPEIKLLLVAEQLPDLDGWQFCQTLRRQHKKEDLAIIGLSSTTGSSCARFIKGGANDSINMAPLITEEFYSRITQCFENLELLQKTRDDAIRDSLTGIYNRRYFFQAGSMLFASSQRQQILLTCAMVDIDLFKKVNDSYGHDVGDLAIKHVAATLSGQTRKTDVVARIGGEEFCILSVNMSREEAAEKFERLRQEIEESRIPFGDNQQLEITVSIGVCTTEKNNIEALVKEADLLLYKAKEGGRNRVICSP